MSFDITNFVINRVLSGSMVSPSTGDISWRISQIEEPSLKCTSESNEVLDAIGTAISSFDRGKKAEFTASNSLLDLNLMAGQMGTDKKIASTASKIKTPMFEIFDFKTGETNIILKRTPTGDAGAEIKQIYSLKSDSSLDTKYILGVAATATEFKLDVATKTITLPTALADGTQILVRYDYDADSAVEVSNTSKDFPKSGKFIMEVFGHDVCDPSTLIYAYLIMPNAKLTGNVDFAFKTDGKHPFTLQCMQSYCDKDKKLFSIIIPEM